MSITASLCYLTAWLNPLIQKIAIHSALYNVIWCYLPLHSIISSQAAYTFFFLRQQQQSTAQHWQRTEAEAVHCLGQNVDLTEVRLKPYLFLLSASLPANDLTCWCDNLRSMPGHCQVSSFCNEAPGTMLVCHAGWVPEAETHTAAVELAMSLLI